MRNILLSESIEETKMIEIIHTKEQGNDLLVYFKITIDKEAFEWHGSCPKDVDPKTHFEAMANKIHFLILQKMYPDADWQRFKADINTELEAMEAWIADGHRNLVGQDEAGNSIYEVIEKEAWKFSHPRRFPPSPTGLDFAFTNITDLADMSYTDVDTYIDNNVTTLATARIYLKRLSKRVLDLIKIVDSKI